MVEIRAVRSVNSAFPVYRPHYVASAIPSDVYFEGLRKKKKEFNPNEYTLPNPSKRFMALLGKVNSFMLRGIPGLRGKPVIGNGTVARGLMNIVEFDLSKGDYDKLRMAINPKTAAFIAGNHPEYFTDMLMDKELASRAFPEVAIWATHEIVNMSKLTKEFFIRNNAITQLPGGSEAGKKYAVDWALKGKGMMLHPEGTVRWTGDKVHSLFPGIVDLSFTAAKKSLEGDKRPVYIVPVVWKLYFPGDVSQGLLKEIEEIEISLDLPVNRKLELDDRFFELQKNLLEKMEYTFALPDEMKKGLLSDKNFFERQRQLRDYLLNKLESKYGVEQGDFDRRTYVLNKKLKATKETDPTTYQDEKQLMEAARHLNGFTVDNYNKPYLTQEHIAESLKRIKKDLSTAKGVMGAFKKMVPIPVGPRKACFGVAEPLEVSAQLKEGVSESDYRAKLLQETQRRMQQRLDELNKHIEPEVSKYRVFNKFYVAPKGEMQVVPPPEQPKGLKDKVTSIFKNMLKPFKRPA